MRVVVLGFIGVLLAAGCSSSVSQGYSPQQAKETLVTALEAWKSGDTKSLSERNPPIRFSDDDQIAGAQMIEYQLELRTILPFQNVKVELVLRDNQGQTLRKTAVYQVGLKPGRTVLRSDH